jgi:hypothetical protein
MLSDEEVTPFGDMRRAFCEESDCKIAQLRMSIKYFRGPSNSEKASNLDPELLVLKQKFGYKIRLQDIDPSELIPYYNPAKASSPITNILKEKFGDTAVIAFKPGTKEIAVEETIDYLADIEQGLPTTDTIEVDGSLVRLYPVGIVPDQAMDEDPLFDNVPLRKQRSAVNRLNWSNVAQDARQFCRLILDAGEIDPNDRLSVRELVKLAEKGVKALNEVYPEVGLIYREKSENNELPKLRVKTSEIKNGKTNHPFNIGSNRSF